MRIRSILAHGAAVAVTLSALGVPASASPGVGIKITPETVVRGSTVTITAVQMCSSATDPYAESSAFWRVPLTDHRPGIRQAVATVRPDAPLGAQVIYLDCGGDQPLVVAFTVVGGEGEQPPCGSTREHRRESAGAPGHA